MLIGSCFGSAYFCYYFVEFERKFITNRVASPMKNILFVSGFVVNRMCLTKMFCKLRFSVGTEGILHFLYGCIICSCVIENCASNTPEFEIFSF